MRVASNNQNVERTCNCRNQQCKVDGKCLTKSVVYSAKVTRQDNGDTETYTGLTFGILAALCQAIGLIIMKPILSMGADPIASASLRTAISFIFLAFTFFLNYEIFKPKTFLTLKIVGQSITSGFLGMALGMSLLLIALQKADAGIVATLSSTSPIMILLLIWLITKKIPTYGAWIGTVLAIIGYGLIFIY